MNSRDQSEILKEAHHRENTDDSIVKQIFFYEVSSIIKFNRGFGVLGNVFLIETYNKFNQYIKM